MNEDLVECPGTFVWYSDHDGGAILVCVYCGFVTCTGNYIDRAHMRSPVVVEKA